MTHLTESQIIAINNLAIANNTTANIGFSENGNIHFSTFETIGYNQEFTAINGTASSFRMSKLINNENSIHAGMECIYEDGMYYVRQYGLGVNGEDEEIYTITADLDTAIQSLILGNKNRKKVTLKNICINY